MLTRHAVSHKFTVNQAIGTIKVRDQQGIEAIELFALAQGMMVDQAWAEVAAFLPPEAEPEPVHPDDLVAAVRRTASHAVFVSGPDELRASWITRSTPGGSSCTRASAGSRYATPTPAPSR